MIDFEHLKIRDLSGKETELNIRESFANAIYLRGTGIVAHAAALKIYNKQPLNDNEIRYVIAFAKNLTPAVADAIERSLNEKD